MRGTEHLHPKARYLAEQLVIECTRCNLNVKITETLRTKAEQDDLYAQGRTKPGSIVTNAKYPESPHCFGVAFDFCRNEKGREYYDGDGFFAKVGAIGKKLGLFWGGDFKSFTDKPHFELSEFLPNNSTKYLVSKYQNFDIFKKTWTPYPIVVEPEEKEEDEMVVYRLYEDIPAYGKETIKKLMYSGFLKGDLQGCINISEDMLRILVINDRAGLYK